MPSPLNPPNSGAPSPADAATSPSLLRVALFMLAPPLVAEALIQLGEPGGIAVGLLRGAGWLIAFAAVWNMLIRPMTAALAESRVEIADYELQAESQRQDRDFRARFIRALDQSSAEPEALRTALRAVDEQFSEYDAELLLAIPDDPNVGWTVRLVDGELLPARPLPETPGCMALASDSTTTSRSPSALDACGHVQDPLVEVSSTCVPLRLGDKVIGVVSVVGPPGEELPPSQVESLEWIVSQTGARVADQRRKRGPSIIGTVDPATGAPGADALVNHLKESTRSLTPYCVAIVNLDAFGNLLSETGQEGADQSLRTLSQVLSVTLRPDDLVSYLDGAEFGVVISNCAGPQALAALERTREALALELTTGESPYFTFSAGIVESHQATSIDDLLGQARSAASEASQVGGNRAVVAA